MAWTKAQSERVLAEIIQRSQRDPAFRRLCIDNPARAVEEMAGEQLPVGFKLRFVDNDQADLTVVLPDPVSTQELSDADLAELSGGVMAEAPTVQSNVSSVGDSSFLWRPRGK